LRTLSGGGDGLAGNLRRELALDDFDVSTTTDGQVEARAGKYLSDQLYSDVILRGAGETEVQLNLQLSPDVTLRGRVDSRGDTGIGLHFEKDY
jgi:translocation and assembly module TamB